MNALEKIRAAIGMARHAAEFCALPGLAAKTDEALAALAELERAATEPVATVCLITDRFAHGHCIEVQLQIDPAAQLPIGTKLYAAAIAAAPKFEAAGPELGLVSREEMAARVEAAYREGQSDFRHGSGITNIDWRNSVSRKQLEAK